MSSSASSFYAAVSRGIREGLAARFFPWRLRRPLERWTIDHAYPAAGSPVLRLTDVEPVATLLFGGDLALHRWQSPDSAGEIFTGLDEAIGSADGFVVNLETQLTSRTVPAGTIGSPLRASPATLGAITRIGASAVSCANNHCLDFGEEGLLESAGRLEEAGITVTGIEGEERDGAGVLAVRGLRLGLLAFTDDWRVGETPAMRARPAAHEPQAVRSAIARLRRRADLVVVQLHWGYEWSMYPLRSHRDLARSYAEAGAHLVVCHHAHVPMGVESWRGSVIAHGLGNLYFGMPKRDTHPFFGASFLLRAGFSSAGVAKAEIVPVSTDAAGRLGVDAGKRADRTLRSVAYLSRRLDRDRYLDAVEESIRLEQGCSLVLDLARRVVSGDRDGARERVRNLEPARQRLLAGSLQELGGLPGRIGRFLQELRESAGDPFAPGVAGELQSLTPPVERLLARARLKGRIP